jgi:hypothetical protein
LTAVLSQRIRCGAAGSRFLRVARIDLNASREASMLLVRIV